MADLKYVFIQLCTLQETPLWQFVGLFSKWALMFGLDTIHLAEEKTTAAE